MDPAARFDDEVARIARENNADVAFRLVEREDSTMARCSFGHDAEEVRQYQVIEKGKEGEPSKVVDEGRSCPEHDEMIGVAKFDRQQNKRIEAAQHFRETTTPNEHTEAVMKNFELDKPAGDTKDHTYTISRPVRQPKERDDRQNIERRLGWERLVHALAVFDSIQVPHQRLGGERVLGTPSLPAPDLQRRAQALQIGVPVTMDPSAPLQRPVS